MIKIFFKYLLSMTIAAALGFIGVHYVIYGVAPWSKEANVSLSISIRGAQNQAVPNAQIFLYAPNKKFIGNTNSEGNFEGLVKAQRGRIAVVEAVGPTFQIRKDLSIPRRASYKAVVRLDSKEAALGNMTLLSKSIEEMSKGLRTKTLSTSEIPTPNATPVAASTPDVSTKPTTPSAAEKSVPPTIQIEVSDERSRTEHRIPMATDIIQEVIKEAQTQLFEKKIRKIRIRPLSAEDSFLEILGLTEHNTYVSSTLIKCTLLNKDVIASAILGLTRPFGDIVEGKLLRVYTSEPEKARAYINGAPLPRTLQNNYAEFNIIRSKVPGERFAIAATADARPLIRKIARTDALLKLVEWHMPEPALSRR